MTRSPGITQAPVPLLVWLGVPLWVLAIACVIQLTGRETVRLVLRGARLRYEAMRQPVMLA